MAMCLKCNEKAADKPYWRSHATMRLQILDIFQTNPIPLAQSIFRNEMCESKVTPKISDP